MNDEAQEFINDFIADFKRVSPLEPELDKALINLGLALLAGYDPLRAFMKDKNENYIPEKFINDFIANNQKGDKNE